MQVEITPQIDLSKKNKGILQQIIDNLYHVNIRYNDFERIIESIPQKDLLESINRLSKGFAYVNTKQAPFLQPQKGFSNFAASPNSHKIKFVKRIYNNTGTFDGNTLLLILKAHCKKFTVSGSIYKLIKNKFNIEFSNEPIPKKFTHTCSINNFYELSNKCNAAELYLSMSICGILISDENEIDEGIVDVGEILKKCNKIGKNLIKARKSIVVQHETMIKLIDYLPLNNNYEKLEEINVIGGEIEKLVGKFIVESKSLESILEENESLNSQEIMMMTVPQKIKFTDDQLIIRSYNYKEKNKYFVDTYFSLELHAHLIELVKDYLIANKKQFIKFPKKEDKNLQISEDDHKEIINKSSDYEIKFSIDGQSQSIDYGELNQISEKEKTLNNQIELFELLIKYLTDISGVCIQGKIINWYQIEPKELEQPLLWIGKFYDEENLKRIKTFKNTICSLISKNDHLFNFTKYEIEIFNDLKIDQNGLINIFYQTEKIKKGALLRINYPDLLKHTKKIYRILKLYNMNLKKRIKKNNEAIRNLFEKIKLYNSVSLSKQEISINNEITQYLTNNGRVELDLDEIALSKLINIETVISDLSIKLQTATTELIKNSKREFQTKIDSAKDKDIRKLLITPIRRMESINDLKNVIVDMDNILIDKREKIKKQDIDIKTIEKADVQNKKIMHFDNPILQLIYLNKLVLSSDYQYLDDENKNILEIIIESIENIDLEEGIDNKYYIFSLLLIENLFINVNQKMILNYVPSNQDINLNIAKIIYLESYISHSIKRDTSDNDLYEHYETISASITDKYKQFFKILNFNFIGNKYKISEKKESYNDQQLSIIKEYFIKKNNKYSNEITKIEGTNIHQQTVLYNMVKTLETDYYNPIANGSFDLKKERHKLFILSPERLWNINKTHESLGFANLSNNLKEIIDNKFKPILAVLQSIDQIKKREVDLHTVDVFYRNDLSELTNNVLDLANCRLVKTLKEKARVQMDDVQYSYDEMANYLIGQIDCAKTQPSLYKYIYSHRLESFDKLIQEFNLDDNQTVLTSPIELLIKDEVYHKIFIDSISSQTEKKKIKDKLLKLNLDIDTKTAQLTEEQKDLIKKYQSYGRFQLCLDETSSILLQIRDDQHFNAEIYKEKRSELIHRNDLFHSMIFDHQYRKYSSTMKNYLDFVEKKIIEESLSLEDLTKYNEWLDLIINELETDIYTNETNYIEYLDSESIVGNDLNSIGLWPLVEEVNKNRSSDDKHINLLREKKDITILFSSLKQIQARYNMPKGLSENSKHSSTGTISIKRKTIDHYKIIYRKLSKLLGYYSDTTNDNCLFIDQGFQLPFFLTSSIKRLKKNSRIIIAILNPHNRHSKKINNLHLINLEDEIYDLMDNYEGENKELCSYNDYSIVCISLARKCPKSYQINHSEKFKSMTIISPVDFVNIFYNSINFERSFSHLMIKSIPLKELNPYSNGSSYNSSDAVYIQREIRQTMFKEIGNGNVAIYGGRRIGKTSICKDIELEYINDENKHALYLSVSNYRYYKGEPNNRFREGLLIGETILSRLTGKNTTLDSFVDFKEQLIIVYNKLYKGKKLLIILDEFDRYILQSNDECLDKEKDNSYQFVDVLRHLHEEQKKITFLISGFIHLWSYLVKEIEHLKADGENPFTGLLTKKFPINSMTSIEARKLISTLEDNLALEFENEGFINHIIQYTGHHPAFIQGFCERLIDNIENRVSQSDRKIGIDDINKVFAQKEFEDDGITPTYYQDFDKIIQMNFQYKVDNISYEKVANALMNILCLLEDSTSDNKFSISRDELLQTFNDAIQDLCDVDVRLKREDFDKTIEVLFINNVISDKNRELSFIYSSWPKYLQNYLWVIDDEYFNNRLLDANKQIIKWESNAI